MVVTGNIVLMKFILQSYYRRGFTKLLILKEKEVVFVILMDKEMVISTRRLLQYIVDLFVCYSCTHIYDKATGPESGFEWIGKFWMCCNRKPTPFCILDQGRQPSPHVPRQCLRAPPCHTWGHTQDSGCAAWGCWVLGMLCSECSWLHYCEGISAG